ncbi:rhomboid family intramembrane serine protease GlpG [Providencia rettgeri]|uniref:rhomboid family intramembrane serine protease GlpG n=1 Tax=Providencia rettgeri TaxID=587 RepID=UPI002360D880|nr:rhomboid family intramembrane serine protease GlpG [Providencia rettgeri]
MIHITSFANPRMAQAFVDYMAGQNIHLSLQPSQEQALYELWLEDDQFLNQVRQELDTFLQNPNDPRYLAASWQTGNADTQFQYRNFLTWGYLKEQSGPLTIAVILLSIIVYLWVEITDAREVLRYLAWPIDDQQSELWRWISPAFVHFSLSHIGFNLALWWFLAGQVERKLGTGKLFTILLVSALFSNWGQSLFSENNFGGLSGVVYALVSYVWLTGERNPESGVNVPRGLMIFSIIWLFFGYFDILGMHIANAAHTSGLIIGLLMGVWDNRHSFIKHQSSR